MLPGDRGDMLAQGGVGRGRHRRRQEEVCHAGRGRILLLGAGPAPAPLLAGLLFGVVDHLAVAGRLGHVSQRHGQVHLRGAGHDQHGLGERRRGDDSAGGLGRLLPCCPLPPLCPTSLELRRVARHQKLAVATAMQNSRMVKMSSTTEIPFPASSRIEKAPSAAPTRKKTWAQPHRVDPTPHFGISLLHLLPTLSAAAPVPWTPRSHSEPSTSPLLQLAERNGYF